MYVSIDGYMMYLWVYPYNSICHDYGYTHMYLYAVMWAYPYISVSSKCGYINMYLCTVMWIYQYVCVSSACWHIHMYPCAVNVGISICICEQCMWVQKG